MVLGGIVLLYKGVVTLTGPSDKNALSVELKKYIRIQTQYPALALFIIGLCFSIFSLYYVNVFQNDPEFTIVGSLEHPCDSMMNLIVRKEWHIGKFDGIKFNRGFRPLDYNNILLVIKANGFMEREIPINKDDLDFDKNVIQLPIIKMIPTAEKDKRDKENISKRIEH